MAEYRINNRDGLRVVQVSGPDDLAAAEVQHYLMMYADEGPLTVEVKRGRRWRPVREVRIGPAQGGA